jgi:Porin PorA
VSVRNVFARAGAGTGAERADGAEPDRVRPDGPVHGPPPEPPERVATARQERGRLSVVLLGVGAFLVVVAALLRFYAAPQLIAAPNDVYETDTLVSPHASYFDEGALVTWHDVRLTYTLTIRGDQRASSGKIAVWDSFASLADPKLHNVINSVYQRSAFNRRTGQMVQCCGASVNDSTQIKQQGIGLFWPIGTKKQTYTVFDNNSMKSWPAHYVGEVKDTGVVTYEFTQHVPATVSDVMTGVPTSLLGIKGPSRNVVANRYYTADNTFWVDPRTGVLVDEEVKAQSYLTATNGQGRLNAVSLDLRMTPGSRHSLADQANKNAQSITMISVLGPLALGVLGIILLVLALAPWRRFRHRDDDPDAPGPDDQPRGPSNFDLLPGSGEG